MPLPQFGYSRDERIYMLVESTYGVTPNSGGVSNLSGANCCSHIAVELDPVVDLYDAEYKTGSRSQIPGQVGRKMGSWRLTLPLKGSGSPGVPADYDPALQSSFGIRNINSGTSVVYALQDNPGVTFSLFRFRQPAALTQQLGISCIPTRVTWTLGQNMANWTLEGQCFWVLDSEQFPTADSLARSGLTVFPSEPSNAITNGTQAQGFVGGLAIDGNTVVNIQQLVITAELGWSHVRDTFGSYYPTGILGGMRRVTATMRAYDDSSAAMQDLRAKGISKGLMSITGTIGNIAGNIHTLNANNGQFDYPKITDAGDRFGENWSAIVFHESTPGAKDELNMVAT